ncbi:transcriptional regulator [Clostridium aceticum]|uniref:Transcriptional regulator n=1 Tax=Clostridium aceticum TaxID=84022 RepID=A0A0D8IFJ8_9CLOT|nr:DRTGG domain-containing protein [Clostridium aceticum]AKL95076.1 transcriptional regulator [Clostridium aceticum]KJF27961.1 DRTGG domain-containing protein [Clostridium aceticum]
MTLKEVQQLLNAEILYGENLLDREANTAFACDLMSDALAFLDDKTLLLTGLVNSHTIRAAEIVDIVAVVFVRGKKAEEEIIKLAEEHEIVIMSTKNTLYVSSGILYAEGLEGASIEYN